MFLARGGGGGRCGGAASSCRAAARSSLVPRQHRRRAPAPSPNAYAPPSQSLCTVRTLRTSAAMHAPAIGTGAMALASSRGMTTCPFARRARALSTLPPTVPRSGGEGGGGRDVDGAQQRRRGGRPPRRRGSGPGRGGGGGGRQRGGRPPRPPKEIVTLARMECHVDRVIDAYGERLLPGGDGRRRGRGQTRKNIDVGGGALPPLRPLDSLPIPPPEAAAAADTGGGDYASPPGDTEALYRELAGLLRKLVLGWCAASSRRHRHHPHVVHPSFVPRGGGAGGRGRRRRSGVVYGADDDDNHGDVASSEGEATSGGGGSDLGDDDDGTTSWRSGGGDSSEDGGASSLSPHVMRAEHWLDVMERLRADRYNSVRRGATSPGTFVGPSSADTPGRGGIEVDGSGGGGVLSDLLGGLRGLFGGGDVAATGAASPPPLSPSLLYTIKCEEGVDEEWQWAHLTPKYSPTVELYNAVLTAYDKSTRPHDAASAQELTRRMEGVLRKMDSAVASGNNPFASPNRDTYHRLMRYYGRSRTRLSARKAEALLQRMDVEAMRGSGGGLGMGTAAAAGDVIADAASAVAPDAETLKLCLSAYAGVRRSAVCALRAEALLERMEQQGAAGEVAAASSVEGDADGADDGGADSNDLAPDTEAYNLCLRAFVNSVVPFGGFGPGRTSKDDIACKAEALVERMKKSEEEGEAAGRTSDSGPDATTYNLAISVLSAGDDGKYVAKALQLLKWMERENVSHETSMCPTTATYNAILSGMRSRLETRNDACEAEKLLDKMILHPDSKPDYTTFDLLFRIWSKAGMKAYCSEAGEKAENLLSRMEIHYAGGNDLVKPDTRMYVHVIRCWACSKRARGIALRARNVLNRIETQDQVGNADVKATQVAYGAVIHACSNTVWPEEKAQALQIAFDCYNKIISLGYSPDAVTYSCLLNCVANLVPAEDEGGARTDLARQVFAAACEQSQVNRAVKYSLRRVSMELYKNYEEQAGHSSRVSKAHATTSGGRINRVDEI